MSLDQSSMPLARLWSSSATARLWSAQRCSGLSERQIIWKSILFRL